LKTFQKRGSKKVSSNSKKEQKIKVSKIFEKIKVSKFWNKLKFPQNNISSKKNV